MRATPLMLAVALGLGVSVLPAGAVTESAGTALRAEDLRTWIVQFEEPAAASFRGFAGDSRRPKLAPTSPAATGAAKYDSRSQAARDYVAYLADLRRIRLADAARKLGRPLAPRYVYAHAINGLSLELTAAEAAQIRTMPGVRAVSPEFHRYTQTDRGPLWINADDIWNGTISGVGSHRGEGQVIGVIDTGINRSHVAFTGTGITNPAGQVYGYCLNNASACNTKVIGLYDFIAVPAGGRADPTDTDGHGTHTAATSGGNPFVVSATTYSGVAPKANIIAYKACPGGDGTSCNGTALIASIDQAVADGVDVINYSIGGGPIDPWITVSTPQVDDTEAFLAAREAGIIVAAAAGNDGPDPGTHGNPANSPWVLGVAAGSHDRTNVASADFLAQFSGRGPVIPFGVVKPDVTAPGVSIRSASITSNTGFTTMSGTSMATPHVAGAAALIKSAKPTWTADQIMSALVLTARASVKTDSVTLGTPHEQGAGSIDVALAVQSGLYLEVPAGAFRAARADVWTGGAQSLNLPSLGHGACFRTCSLTRTFKLMPGASAANYNISVSGLPAGATITPNVSSFTSTAGGNAITFNVNVSNAALVNTWVYGTVTLTNTSGDGRPNLKLPVAIFSTPFEDAATEAALSVQERTVLNERGFFDIDVGGMIALPNARFGASALVAPVSSVHTITEDPTNDDAYDVTTQNYIRLVTVPAGANIPVSLSASTRAASGDIDLFVGQDLNANGSPDESEELCVSASSDANEDCTLELNGAGAARTFWVMVQNYDNGSATTVEHSVVAATDADSLSLIATGPGNIPAGSPFKIRVAWDDPTLLPGQSRVGFVVVKPSPTGAAINVPVRLTASGGLLPAPFGLTPGTARKVALPAGGAHERLYVDVPPGITQMTLRTANGTGSVSLYGARIDPPVGPVVANAPARGAASHSATGAGANQTIVINNPAAGRWYVTPVNTGGGAATVDVSATFNSFAAVPALKRGSYYNPGRGGHGIFLYPSGPDHALLWYTYLQDGTPTWYYAQGTQPTGNQIWNGTVYRAAWNGSSRTLEAIGNIVLSPRSATTISMTYNIDGFTGSETLDTFLTGCPTVGTPLDVSAHWYDPVATGYGYSVQVNPNYEFMATFVYDGIGVPRFLAAERGGAFDAANTTLQLDQLAGFAPLGAHAAPVRTSVGTLTRTYGPSTIVSIGTNANFANGIPGTWARNAAVSRLSDQPQGCTP